MSDFDLLIIVPRKKFPAIWRKDTTDELEH